MLLIHGAYAAGDEPSPTPAPTPSADGEAVRLQEMVISASRVEQPLADVAANVTVLTQSDVEQSAAQTVDDFLRQVPGFSLFRRQSSLVSNPTTQGVSLRGIGPSGVSRALVLLDGIPLNDPFGGWVYWSRIPMQQIQQVEIARGAGSNVWGNYAMDGVINITTAGPTPRTVQFYGEGGTRGTVNLDLFGSHVIGPLGVALQGNYFRTDGYPVIKTDQRGLIDIPPDSEHEAFNGKLRYELSPDAFAFLNGTYFNEDRGNGTPLTHNGTQTGVISGGAQLTTADNSQWKLTAFGNLQTFTSTFSTQAPDRNSEVPALDQRVPSTAIGTSLQWLRPFLETHMATAGLDFQWIDGETQEQFRFVDDHFTAERHAGGTQQLIGIYGEDLVTPLPGLQVTAGGRIDIWRSLDGHRIERSLDTGQLLRDDTFPDRDDVQFSPKLALLYDVTDALSLRAAGYKGFRAPTLNELFRPFRVRNDITEANADLDPETLYGGELGLTYAESIMLAKLTGYWNDLQDPITNVTVGFGPGTIAPCGMVPDGGVCRQRQNLGLARFRGVEVEVDVHPYPYWTGSVSYLYVDTDIVSAPAEPQLVGNQVAQVPPNQFVIKLSYDNPRILTSSVQVRYVGNQFEDDLNTLNLGDFTVVDLYLGRQIRPGWDIFFSIENVFNRVYDVAKTADGVVTIGAPLLAHGGVSITF